MSIFPLSRRLVIAAILVATLAASSLTFSVARAAQAAEAQCDGHFHTASVQGSFEATEVRGGLPTWPAVRNTGNYRVGSFNLVCTEDRWIPNSLSNSLTVRIGDLKFGVGPNYYWATSFSTASRSWDQSVVTGVGLIEGVDGRWPFELTLRDKDDRLWTQGGEPGDYIKIKIFDPHTGELLLVAKGPMWGNKLTSLAY